LKADPLENRERRRKISLLSARSAQLRALYCAENKSCILYNTIIDKLANNPLRSGEKEETRGEIKLLQELAPEFCQNVTIDNQTFLKINRNYNVTMLQQLLKSHLISSLPQAQAPKNPSSQTEIDKHPQARQRKEDLTVAPQSKKRSAQSPGHSVKRKKRN